MYPFKHIGLVLLILLFPFVLLGFAFLIYLFNFWNGPFTKTDFCNVLIAFMHDLTVSDYITAFAGITTYYGTSFLGLSTLFQNDRVMELSKRELELNERKSRFENMPEIALTGLWFSIGTEKEARDIFYDPCEQMYKADVAIENELKPGIECSMVANVRIEGEIPEVVWGVAEITNFKDEPVINVYGKISTHLPLLDNPFMQLVHFTLGNIISSAHNVKMIIETAKKRIENYSVAEQAVIKKMDFHMLGMRDYHFVRCGSIRTGGNLYLPFIVEQGSKIQYGSLVQYENVAGQKFYNRLEVELNLYGTELNMSAKLYSQSDSVRCFGSGSRWGYMEYTWCYPSFEVK